MASKLIGKVVTITSKDSMHQGAWGTVKDFDGEYYYIAIYDSDSEELVFTRSEFRVKRERRS